MERLTPFIHANDNTVCVRASAHRMRKVHANAAALRSVAEQTIAASLVDVDSALVGCG